MITITINEKEILQNPSNDSLGEYVRNKFEHEMFVLNNSFDKCVVCGKETPYLKTTHIDKRVGYVDGGGQGCYQPRICNKV